MLPPATPPHSPPTSKPDADGQALKFGKRKAPLPHPAPPALSSPPMPAPPLPSLTTLPTTAVSSCSTHAPPAQPTVSCRPIPAPPPCSTSAPTPSSSPATPSPRRSTKYSPDLSLLPGRRTSKSTPICSYQGSKHTLYQILYSIFWTKKVQKGTSFRKKAYFCPAKTTTSKVKGRKGVRAKCGEFFSLLFIVIVKTSM